MSEEVSTSKSPSREVRWRWRKLPSIRKGMIKTAPGSATLVGSKVYLAFNNGTISVLSLKKWHWKSLGQRLLGLTQYHVAVLVGDKIFYFGQGSGPLLVEYDLVLRTARRVKTANEGPLRRPSKSCVFASWRNEIISFGGFMTEQGRTSNETHALNVETKFWTKLEIRGELPPARIDHEALMCGTKMYIYGGSGQNYEQLRHIWIAELGYQFAPFWSRPVNYVEAPAARSYSFFNKLGDVLVVFGGFRRGILQRKLEKFFTQTKMWQTPLSTLPKVEGEDPHDPWFLLSVNITNGILYLTDREMYSLTED